MRRLRAGAVGIAGVALLVALSGCSQVAAIAPVGGSRLAETRFAANDLLVGAGIDIRTAPACTQASDATITCEGDTFDGTAILVTAPGSSPDDLEVTVGSDTLYRGSLSAVYDKAADGTATK
ncbi:hypothetical protein [Microbacterium sp. CJ88]|uniref:hypothetical protein n=1 Tax=Microbacterium sp. CJ88 TaxID=3445672 RepID=UPI003F655763